MKIITPGIIPVKKPKTWIFKCPNCGCVFEPEEKECWVYVSGIPYCHCPTCDKIVQGKEKIYREMNAEANEGAENE